MYDVDALKEGAIEYHNSIFELFKYVYNKKSTRFSGGFCFDIITLGSLGSLPLE